nr:hypothetical protein [Tanacetum cinerariifolium]
MDPESRRGIQINETIDSGASDVNGAKGKGEVDYVSGSCKRSHQRSLDDRKRREARYLQRDSTFQSISGNGLPFLRYALFKSLKFTHIRQLSSCFFTITGFDSQLWRLSPFLFPYRKGGGKEDSSNPIHGARNDKIPSGWRNSHIAEQQDHPTRMLNGFGTRSTVVCH